MASVSNLALIGCLCRVGTNKRVWFGRVLAEGFAPGLLGVKPHLICIRADPDAGHFEGHCLL